MRDARTRQPDADRQSSGLTSNACIRTLQSSKQGVARRTRVHSSPAGQASASRRSGRRLRDEWPADMRHGRSKSGREGDGAGGGTGSSGGTAELFVSFARSIGSQHRLTAFAARPSSVAAPLLAAALRPNDRLLRRCCCCSPPGRPAEQRMTTSSCGRTSPPHCAIRDPGADRVSWSGRWQQETRSTQRHACTTRRPGPDCGRAAGGRECRTGRSGRCSEQEQERAERRQVSLWTGWTGTGT